MKTLLIPTSIYCAAALAQTLSAQDNFDDFDDSADSFSDSFSAIETGFDTDNNIVDDTIDVGEFSIESGDPIDPGAVPPKKAAKNSQIQLSLGATYDTNASDNFRKLEDRRVDGRLKFTHKISLADGLDITPALSIGSRKRGQKRGQKKGSGDEG